MSSTADALEVVSAALTVTIVVAAAAPAIPAGPLLVLKVVEVELAVTLLLVFVEELLDEAED